MTTRSPAGWLPWLALGVVYVVWGSTYLAIRFMVGSLPPLFGAGARFLIAGAVLVLILLAVRGPRALRMSRAQLGTSVLVGLLLIAAQGTITFAEQYVPSGLAALLVAAVPLYIAVMRWVGGTRPPRVAALGLLVGLVGLVLLLVLGGRGSAAAGIWWGAPLMLLSALSWSLGTVLSGVLPLPADPFASAAVQMLFGGLALTIVGLATGERIAPGAVSTQSWLALGYLVVFGAVLVFPCYVFALARLPVSTVSTFAYVNPVVAVVLGVLLGGESFGGWQLVGGVLVVVAVVLLVRGGRPVSGSRARMTRPTTQETSL